MVIIITLYLASPVIINIFISWSKFLQHKQNFCVKLKPFYYTQLFIQSIHHQLNLKSVFMVKGDLCLE